MNFAQAYGSHVDAPVGTVFNFSPTGRTKAMSPSLVNIQTLKTRGPLPGKTRGPLPGKTEPIDFDYTQVEMEALKAMLYKDKVLKELEEADDASS